MAQWNLKGHFGATPRVGSDRCPVRESQDKICCSYQLVVITNYRGTPEKKEDCKMDKHT